MALDFGVASKFRLDNLRINMLNLANIGSKGGCYMGVKL